MRVLVFGLVGTNMGGIESFLLNMNDHMDSDFIFDYIIEEDSCMHEERISNKGGHIFKIPSRVKSPAKNLREIRRILKEEKKNTNIAYFNLSSLSWIFPEMIARSLGYKVVVHSHNAMLIDANSDWLHKTVNAISRKVIRNGKYVRLACSEYAADFMFGKNSDAIVVKNAIDVQKYRFNASVRERIRQELHLGGKSIVGFVGRFNYEKNPSFVVEVFAEMLKIKSECKLLMLGDGKLRPEVERKIAELGIKNDVILAGNVSNVQEYIQAMDMFLFPSLHEGLGIVLIEAQTAGLPCVTSADVVPSEANITNIIEREDLKYDASVWAQRCVDVLQRSDGNDRGMYYKMATEAGYEIAVEAKRLQSILER